MTVKLEHEHYLDHGWVKAPVQLINDEYTALRWLADFETCIYPGLNSREFSIVEIDSSLTLQYDNNQPRRFHISELYFHS